MPWPPKKKRSRTGRPIEWRRRKMKMKMKMGEDITSLFSWVYSYHHLCMRILRFQDLAHRLGLGLPTLALHRKLLCRRLSYHTASPHAHLAFSISPLETVASLRVIIAIHPLCCLISPYSSPPQPLSSSRPQAKQCPQRRREGVRIGRRNRE